MKKVEVKFIDYTQNFCDNKDKDNFLKFDPMHLSINGHKKVYNLLLNEKIFKIFLLFLFIIFPREIFSAVVLIINLNKVLLYLEKLNLVQRLKLMKEMFWFVKMGILLLV